MSEGGGSFKIAEAFVEVILKDRTAEDLERIKARLERGEPIGLNTTANTTANALPGRGAAQESSGGGLTSATSTTKVDADISAAEAKIEQTKVKLDELKAKKTDPKVDLEIAAATAKADELKAKLEELSTMRPSPKVDAETTTASMELERIQLKIDDLEKKRASPKIDADTAAAEARLAQLEAQLAALSAKRTNLHFDSSGLGNAKADAEGAVSSLDKVGSSANSSGSALGAMGKWAGIGLGVIAPLAVTAAAAIAAIGPAALGAGAALAAIGGGFLGAGKAIKGYSADQKAAASAGNHTASTQLSNAIAIRNANQSISDAAKNRARAYDDASDNITQAERRVTDAREHQSRAYADSADRIETSEQRVTDAHRSQEMAQSNLTEARRRAAHQIDELNKKVADMAINEEGASLSVEQSQLRLRYALANPLTTDLERRQAAYEVKQAMQRLADLKHEDALIRVQAQEANAKGIEGDHQVVASKNAVITANEGVQKAEHELGKAVTEEARRRADTDEAVTNSVHALEKAHTESNRKRADADETLAKSQQHLADTIELQAAAAAAAAGRHSEFAKEMAKLTPAGQAFVMQLLAMKPLVDDLMHTAQDAMLPGFTQMLKDSAPMFPIFNTAVADMGHVFGDTARRAGEMFQSPVFQGQMEAALQNSIPLFKLLSDGMLNLFAGFVRFGSVAGPAIDGLVGGFHAIGAGVGEFMDALTPAMGSIGSLTQSTGRIIGSLLGPFGELVAMVATALAPAFAELSSGPLSNFVGILMSGLKPIIEALGPVLLTVVQAFERILPVLAPLIPVIGDLFAAFLPIVGVLVDIAADLIVQLQPVFKWLAGFITESVIPALKDFAKFLTDNKGPIEDIATMIGVMFIPMLIGMGAQALIAAGKMALAWVMALGPIPIIAAAVAGLVYLIIAHWDDIKAFTEKVWNWIFENVIRPVWDSIKGFIGGAVDGIKGILDWFGGLGRMFAGWFIGAKDAAIGALTDLINWVGGLGRKIWDGLGNLGNLLVDVGRSILDGLFRGLKEAWRGITDFVGGIGQWIKDHKGPMSVDMVLLEPAGTAIMDGLLGGLKAQEPALTGYLGGLTNKLSNSLSGVNVGVIGGDGSALSAAGMGGRTGSPGAGGDGAGTVVHMDNVVVNVTGIVDLSDPYSMSQGAKRMIFQVRDALRVVEGQYT